MSKVLETLDLRTRLENLYESLTDNNGSSRLILEKYMREIGLKSDYHILRDVCNEMKTFDWLAPVESFINEAYKFAKDNELSFAVLNTLEAIRTSKDQKSFSAVINALEEIKDLSESQLKNAVISSLKKHTWVPGIKELVALSENISGTNKTTDNRFTSTRPVSPVLENVNGETIFCVGDRVYAMDESEEIRLAHTDEIDESFVNLVQLAKNFTPTEEGLRLSENNCNIDLVVNEGDKDTEIYVDGQLVKESQLAATLMANGKFRHGQYDTIKVLEHALNKIDSIYELDFVETIKSNVYEGVEVNVMKSGTNLYINKINPSMNENTLIKTETASDAINLVQEFVDYDITNSVQDLLEGEAKLTADKAKAEHDIYERIDYIKDEISKLSELGMDDMDSIKEAKKVLSDALEAQQGRLNTMFKSKGVTVHEASDADYVPGELKMKTNGYRPGTKVQINAGQYTESGTKDMISIILPTNEIIEVQKKYLDVTI
jgi:hypothetical protein